MSEFSLCYGSGDGEVDKRETLFKGYFQMDALTLRHRRSDGSCTEGIRRGFFERGDAFAVLPWHVESDTVVLIEQFRPGAIRGDNPLWMPEAVAGVVGSGESDSDVAHWDALEEAGCSIDAAVPFVSCNPDHGACSEQSRSFEGNRLSAAVDKVWGADTEHKDTLVHSVPCTDAIALLDAKKIKSELKNE